MMKIMKHTNYYSTLPVYNNIDAALPDFLFLTEPWYLQVIFFFFGLFYIDESIVRIYYTYCFITWYF